MAVTKQETLDIMKMKNEEQEFKLTFSSLGGSIKLTIWKTAKTNKEALEKALKEDQEVLGMFSGKLYNTSVISKKAIDKSNLLTIKKETRN